MSGICVLVKNDPSAKVAESDMEPLASAMAPSEGTSRVHSKTHDNVGFAAVDRFGRGRDRFFWENGDILVVCDADLYNAKDLDPDPDAAEPALVGRLYLRHGKEWWRDVRGVYSAFVWDKGSRKGFAFTDRLGVKPLLYHAGGGLVAVASQVKAIAKLPGFRKEISRQAMFSFVQMEAIPTPYSIFEGVHKLESGHGLCVENGHAVPERLWNMPFPPQKLSDEEAIKKDIFSELREAVRLQTEYRADPETVGAFLSGGTDSSSIVGMMNLLRPGKVRTFSMGFDEAGYDEMHYARIAQKAYGTRHTEYYVTQKDILDSLPKIVEAYDEPFANSSAIPSYLCAKLAADNGIRVLLGGDGGDEIFGGNSRYVSTLASPSPRNVLAAKLMGPWLGLVPGRSPFVRNLRAFCARPTAPLEARIHDYSLTHYFPPDEIFAPEFLAGWKPVTPEDISRRYLEAAGTDSALDRFLYHDLKLTLMDNDLRKVGRMTELAGVEVRYPFLDGRLVELTGRIPDSLKIRQKRLRYVFKESMRGFLPEEIIEKRKHGFGIPVVRWMLRPGALNDRVKDTLFDGRLQARKIFHPGFVEELYKRSQDDKTTFFGVYLYYIFFLEAWLRHHI